MVVILAERCYTLTENDVLASRHSTLIRGLDALVVYGTGKLCRLKTYHMKTSGTPRGSGS